MSACCGAGMSLPDWPVQSMVTINQNDLINLYQQQNNYFEILFTINECARRYKQLFYQKWQCIIIPNK